ncbi:MAG TPA: hypothetical protein VGZ23_08000 [bacterium]|nr:hypothetical protein [bacterium]
MSLPVLLEGPGHVYSDGDFEPGGWHLDIVATTRNGDVVRAHLVIQL